MARIKHIAIRTDDVEKTSAFYKEVFELKQVGLGRNGVYLSDGHINLAVLRRQPEIEGGDRVGIDHLGFKVDDVHGTLSVLKQLGGEAITDPVTVIPTEPSQAQSYYEIKCLGPDGQVIDVSGSGWVGND
jgi:catechol 2,3-dioxygenase-like lactoylglutathione lyase family enzyme